jgi:hypothetical protein
MLRSFSDPSERALYSHSRLRRTRGQSSGRGHKRGCCSSDGQLRDAE